MKQKLNYGEIYLVDFEPSVGHEYQKQRPAVIIQSNRQLNQSNLITIMPLTSQIKKKHPDDILMRKNSTNRLWSDSLIKVHSITSFDQKRFLKRIGETDQVILDKIKEYLRSHFDL